MEYLSFIEASISRSDFADTVIMYVGRTGKKRREEREDNVKSRKGAMEKGREGRKKKGREERERSASLITCHMLGPVSLAPGGFMKTLTSPPDYS